ncbi:MAG: fumarylacetoacetate hydrolase family protein [Acidobacteriaceae bacterium]
MTGSREKDLLATANLLMDARRAGHRLTDLPKGLRPVNAEEVDAIQDMMARGYGDIGGWKIGATTPEATPSFCPMPADWIGSSGSLLSGERWNYRVVEAEIAFLVGEDLPPRAAAYSREEVLAAVASCHPAIEVLETAFVDPTAVAPNSMLADLQRNGGFFYGAAFADWKKTDFNAERVTLAVDGSVRVERTGSNTSGDLLRLLPWLANEGAARTGGLRAGQWITTGSWTGNTPAFAGADVDVEFSTAGRVSVRFA